MTDLHPCGGSTPDYPRVQTSPTQIYLPPPVGRSYALQLVGVLPKAVADTTSQPTWLATARLEVFINVRAIMLDANNRPGGIQSNTKRRYTLSYCI